MFSYVFHRHDRSEPYGEGYALKVLLVLLLFAMVFGLGYYVGQRPDEVKQALREFSGDVLENTIGLKESLTLRREFLGAKEGLVQGKVYLLDHEYEKAAQELGKTLAHLENTIGVDPDGQLDQRVDELIAEVRETQQQLAGGKGVSRRALDEMQKKLDGLLP